MGVRNMYETLNITVFEQHLIESSGDKFDTIGMDGRRYCLFIKSLSMIHANP